MPKDKNRPIGENSPNLVTMVLSFDPLTCFHGRPGLPDFS
jgi:hypothetical protein